MRPSHQREQHFPGHAHAGPSRRWCFRAMLPIPSAGSSASAVWQSITVRRRVKSPLPLTRSCRCVSSSPSDSFVTSCQIRIASPRLIASFESRCVPCSIFGGHVGDQLSEGDTFSGVRRPCSARMRLTAFSMAIKSLRLYPSIHRLRDSYFPGAQFDFHFTLSVGSNGSASNSELTAIPGVLR